MRRILLILFLILASGLDAGGVRAAQNGTVREAVRVAALPAPVLSLSRHENGELFFEIDDAAPPASDRAARPRRVRVYWDHSASRADDDLGAETDLLLRYLDTVHPGIIDLVVFSGGAPELTIIEAPHEAAQIAGVLQHLRYEGGGEFFDPTDLPLPPADACLYFSDGAINIDPADAQRMRCPLFAISSAEDANRGLLRVLARRSAGAHFDLGAIAVDDAVARMTGAQPRVLAVASSEGREIEYALLPAREGRFRIVGPVPSSGGIAVTLTGGGKRTLTRTYSSKAVRAQQDDELATLWAMDRLYELCARTDPESERIAALARRYAVDAPLPAN